MKKLLTTACLFVMTTVAIVSFVAPTVFGQAQKTGDPKLTEVWDPIPPVVTAGLGRAPPSDAIILFNGKDLSQWQSADGSQAKWAIANRAFTVVKGTGDIHTKRAFGDCQLHVEWRTPRKIEGEGQGRGN